MSPFLHIMQSGVLSHKLCRSESFLINHADMKSLLQTMQTGVLSYYINHADRVPSNKPCRQESYLTAYNMQTKVRLIKDADRSGPLINHADRSPPLTRVNIVSPPLLWGGRTGGWAGIAGMRITSVRG
jgi:hypothetical protein